MIAFTVQTDDGGITDVRHKMGLVGSLDDSISEESLGMEPSTRYLTVMVPMPDGYRLATEEDKKGRKPGTARVMDAYGKFGEAYPNGRWDPGVHIVPEKQPQVKVIVAGKEKMIDHGTAVELGLL